MTDTTAGSGPDVGPDPAYRPCVGIVLTNPAGLVWAGQRADSSASAWQMPQGGIDPGEDPQTAALRELQEETGITQGSVRLVAATSGWLSYDLPPDLAARMWKGRYKGQTQKWFHLGFEGTDDEIDIAQPNPEFTRWAWMTPDDVVAKIVAFKRQLYQDVLTELGFLSAG